MYTITIIGLMIISLLLVIWKWKEYKTKKFKLWLASSCLVGWIEFITFLRHKAWQFDPDHVIGVEILGVTIEDYLFCPCFSVIFFRLYFMTKKWFQRVFNPEDKLWYAIGNIGVALFFYDIGSQFSKYMAVRAAIGLIGLLYCWNYSSFRHSLVFLGIVYIIGFGWDLPSVANRIWYYVPESGILPGIYCGLKYKILGAWFPLELFVYYYTGGFFSFWIIAFFDRYFDESHSYEHVRGVK